VLDNDVEISIQLIL